MRPLLLPEHTSMQFALTYADSVFDTRTAMMGRQSAGVGFLRAALDVRPERLWCYAATRDKAETFGRDVRDLTTSPPEIRFISWQNPFRLASAGMLYRADPDIAQDAWHRQRSGGSRAYSLCGVTHSLSSQKAMSVMASLVTAPLYPWDAVICTSTVARDAMRHVLEAEIEHLRSRLGATAFTLPQMPLIPLGVHALDFATAEPDRAAARADLGLEQGDVAVLFAGRLSFHAKAHPLPMFIGLQTAAERTGRAVHLLLFGRFPTPQVGEAFAREASQFAPSVKLRHLDGAVSGNQGKAWAAADIFTSLSDNAQETFGLTPVEAMAAGLPVVVSDWNGYKDTVRDGIDGFRIPTSMPGAGNGVDLALRAEMGLDNYDYHVGALSQFTAVDVERAGDAYARLVGDEGLRRTMGEAGRRRVMELYDWRIVFRRYRALWDELAERRRADVCCPGEDARAGRPDRPDPFALFRTFPTGVLGASSLVRLTAEASVAVAASRRALASVGYSEATLPRVDDVARVLGVLTTDEWQPLSTVEHPPSPAIVRTAAWLLKMGLMTIQM